MATSTRAIIVVENPVHEYHLDCVFKNISKQLYSMESPGFNPVPGSLEQWCLKLSTCVVDNGQRKLMIRIQRLQKHTICKLKYSFSLENIHGEIWRSSGNCFGREYTMSDDDVAVYDSCIDFRLISTITSVFKCPEDKLVVKAKFFISGITMSSSHFQFQQSPNRNFQLNLIDDLRKMYESSSDSDITFSLEDGELKAHKNIIKSRCPAFSTMLNQPMVEKETNRVIIKDIAISVFDCFFTISVHGRYQGR